MKFVSFFLIVFCLGLIFSCGTSKRDCPDTTLLGTGKCEPDTAWVCGCDDVTYINECLANKRGAWVQYSGKCEE